MGRRFGPRATIEYLDTKTDGVRESHADAVALIRERGLVYPVTMVDGEPVAQGSVSYPAVLRAISTRLAPSDA